MKKYFNVGMALLLILGLLFPAGWFAEKASAEPTVVLLSDFEDATLQDWQARGTGSVTTVTEEVYAGNYSLKSAGRSATWNGPALNVTSLLQQGAVYEISAYVKLTAGIAPSQIKMTVQRTSAGETSPAYDQVSPLSEITDSAWVRLTGTYTYSGNASDLLLYIESDSADASYYIDDVTIVETSPPPADSGTPELPADTTGISADFEEADAQGWGPRMGEETVTPTTEDKHEGSYSLKTTGRQHTFAGPTIDVTAKMQKGSKYHVSVWMKLASGEEDTQARVSLQVDREGADTSYKTIVPNTPVTDSAWVHLDSEFKLSDAFDKLSLYVETDTGTASFYIDDFTLTYVGTTEVLPIQEDIPSVYQQYSSYFPIGAAVLTADTEGVHGELLAKHFNSIVAGNAMKWDATEPEEGQFDFSRGDTIVQFAKQHHMKIRGHTLLWHQQVPDWLFKDELGNEMTPTPENKQLLLQRLEHHIKTVVEHYGDDVYAWDVVNEVIDPSQPDGLRRSQWYEIIGPEYIDKAFEYAHKYAPHAKLFINDYNTVNDPVKRQFLFELVQSMKQRGIPVDGVGHQMHINIASPSAEAVKQTLELFAGLGLENQITELDMSVYTSSSDPGYDQPPEDVLIRQGYRYKAMFDVFKEERDKANLTSVTIWGLADDNTWLSGRNGHDWDFPLLFDTRLQAKPAYWGVVDPSQLPIMTRTLDTGKGSPVIDGTTDLLWDAVSATSVASVDGAVQAKFKTMWDDTHLYVYAKVYDPTVSPGDQADIYVDANNGKTTTYQADDVHYSLERDTSSSAAGIDYRITEQTGGYMLEAAIPLASAELGQQVGFDLRLTDADASHGPISWNDTTNGQDSDTSHYGTLSLSQDLKVATAVKGTPQIDGVEDSIWSSANEVSTDTWLTGVSGASAKIKTMWDAGHLYVLAHVTDPLLSKGSENAYEQDSVEIFVDQNNGKTAAYEADDGQYRVNFDNEQSYNGAASASNFQTATHVFDGGYNVEAAISLDQMEAREGELIGFDFQVNNDADADGKRDSVVIWSDTSGLSYMNTSKWGVLRLGLGEEEEDSRDHHHHHGSAAPNTPTNPGEVTAMLDDNGHATAAMNEDDLERALQNVTGDTLVIQVTATDEAKKVTISIPATLYDKAVHSGLNNVEINTGLVDVVFPLQVFAGQVDDNSKTIQFTVGKKDAELNDAKRHIEGRHTVYDFSLSVDDQTISRFDGGQPVRVSVPFTLEPGVAPGQVVVYSITDQGELEVVRNGRYVPSTGFVVFHPVHFSSYAVIVTSSALKDLSSVPWAEQSIEALAVRGMIDGPSDENFAPKQRISKAAYVQMLMNALSLTNVKASSSFSDVEEGAEYSLAIASAEQLGIVAGRKDGTFGVQDEISRQDMVLIAYRAALAAHVALNGSESSKPFTDQSAIAEYAKEAVSAMRKAGIVKGTGTGKFAPDTPATRAEAAVIIYQLYNKMSE